MEQQQHRQTGYTIDFFDYTNAHLKRARSVYSGYQTNGDPDVGDTGMRWQSTAVISRIDLGVNSGAPPGTLASTLHADSRFTLYGVL